MAHGTKDSNGLNCLDLATIAAILRRHGWQAVPPAKAQEQPVADAGLAEDEVRVVRALCLHPRAQDAARAACLSHSTLKRRRARIYRKLGVTGRVELIRRATDLGLLTL